MRLLTACLIPLCCWFGLVRPGLADELPLRPSARLLFKMPDLARPGACVAYREGGSGWIATEPVYYLRGTVLSADIQARPLNRCPDIPGKSLAQYSRDEFIRLAKARPCVSPDTPPHNEQVGLIRLRVEEWETPWGRKAASAGRLYQGHFLDQPLKAGQELTIEADLLVACES